MNLYLYRLTLFKILLTFALLLGACPKFMVRKAYIVNLYLYRLILTKQKRETILALENRKQRIMSVLSKLDLKIDAKLIGLGILTGLITVRFLLKSDLPTVRYSSDKKDNFTTITTKVKENDLPKMFWATGFYPFDLKRMLVITDFDIMERVFKLPAVSNRITTPK